MGVTKMNNKTDQTIQKYLNSISVNPLLTRDQEIVLIKDVEVFQKEILNQIVVSKYSRTELYNFLLSKDGSGEAIIDLSKKLDDESPKDLVASVESSFKLLIQELTTDNIPSILNLLNEVSLTGTIIHGVVMEIKEKYNSIIDAEAKVKQIMKYFMDETNQNVIFAAIDVGSDKVMFRLNEFGFVGIKADNKFKDWTHIVHEYRQTIKNLPKDTSLDEVKEIYKGISKYEHQASKFKNELITRNLRLVVSRAKNYMGKGLEFEDLIQEGNLGLMKAVDKFDSSKKTKISTYATWWIDQSIRRAISNKGKTVRVPTHIEWMQTNLNQLIHKMTGELKRPPTLEEISVKSGIDLDTLRDLDTRPQHEVGIEEEMSSGMSLMDVLHSDPSTSPFVVTEQKILREKIRDILATLPPRTEKIIRLRFGIGEVPDDEGTTLQDIANQIGITKQGVRVVECSAFKLLKKKAKRLSRE